MYHAKLHPEQYSDTFSPAQLKQLHASILYVCQTAVDTLADSEKFPDDWLFKHRWGKGKKGSKMELPNGAKITFLTVGGRTSCVVPSVQKKTGAVAGDVGDDDAKAGGKGAKKKAAKVEAKEEEEDEDEKPKGRKRKADPVKKEMKEAIEDEEDVVEKEEPKGKKRKADPAPKETKKAKANGTIKSESESKVSEVANGTGRRRSGRVSKG
jgi:formamidopyrimidine-DNA glycosylase